jgi:hypothetical protein
MNKEYEKALKDSGCFNAFLFRWDVVWRMGIKDVV